MKKPTEYRLYEKGEFTDVSEDYIKDIWFDTSFELMFKKKESDFNRFFLREVIKFYTNNFNEIGIGGLVLRIDHHKFNLKSIRIYYLRNLKR